MRSFAGLDVSEPETQICGVSDKSEVLFEGRCVTEPGAIAGLLGERAPGLDRAVPETGSMSGWLGGKLNDLGIPAICTCARQVHGVLKGKPYKYDRNDALMLARMARANLLTPQPAAVQRSRPPGRHAMPPVIGVGWNALVCGGGIRQPRWGTCVHLIFDRQAETSTDQARPNAA